MYTLAEGIFVTKPTSFGLNWADHETTVSAERMWAALKNSTLSSRKCSKLDISGVPETGT